MWNFHSLYVYETKNRQKRPGSTEVERLKVATQLDHVPESIWTGSCDLHTLQSPPGFEPEVNLQKIEGQEQEHIKVEEEGGNRGPHGEETAETEFMPTQLKELNILKHMEGEKKKWRVTQ